MVEFLPLILVRIRGNFCVANVLVEWRTHFSFIGQLRNQKFVVNWLAFHSSNRQRYSSTACEIDPSYTSSCYPHIDKSKFDHPFKKWTETRIDKLTASTFAGAIGYWPRRRVQLWREKLGIKERFKGNLATYWDVVHEEDALQTYLQITGHDVFIMKPPVYHPIENDWLAASPDRLIYCSSSSRGVLEIKCPYLGGDGSKGPHRRVPLYYIPQAQGLMEILDVDWMHFYVWTLNGSSLFKLYRDVEYWDLLKVALADFWWDHVEPARELYRRSAGRASLTEIDCLRPAPKHELCSKIVCESRRVLQNTELIYREVNGVLQY